MLEDFRTLKQGDEFNFDFSKHPEILIAGDNGCGKSTLVNIIRDYQCDNSKDDPNAVYQTKLGYCNIRGFKNKVEISTDFTRLLVPNLMTQRVLIIVLQQKLYLRMEGFRQNVCLQVREV